MTILIEYVYLQTWTLLNYILVDRFYWWTGRRILCWCYWVKYLLEFLGSNAYTTSTHNKFVCASIERSIWIAHKIMLLRKMFGNNLQGPAEPGPLTFYAFSLTDRINCTITVVIVCGYRLLRYVYDVCIMRMYVCVYTYDLSQLYTMCVCIHGLWWNSSLHDDLECLWIKSKLVILL